MIYRIERDNIIVGDPEHEFVISFEALAAWKELLGIEDDVEVIEAMVQTLTEGEPEPDPETGRNHWSDAYEALSDRENGLSSEVKLTSARNTARRALAIPEIGAPVRRSLAVGEPSEAPLDGLQSLIDEHRDRLNTARDTFLQSFRRNT